MSTNDIMAKLHAIELKIALEVKRICEKNGINYFLTAGTLLGAVRHGGFIPWDDDMDIGMLREEYNKFIKACETDLGEEFFLQTWDTDPEFPFSYAKIRLNGTHFVEEFSSASTAHNGIFVDVFPFDAVPEGRLRRFIQREVYFVCKRLLWIKKGMGESMKGSPKQRVRYYSFFLFSKLFKYKNIKTFFSRVQQKYNGLDTQKVVTDGSYAYEKESIERKWVNDLALTKFESEEFLSYKDKLEYLTYFYGNYMKLPPEEKRNRHNLVNVDFGEYAQIL